MVLAFSIVCPKLEIELICDQPIILFILPNVIILTLLIHCLKYIININKKNNFVLKNFTDQPEATPYYGQNYDNITYKLGDKSNVKKISIELLAAASMSRDREEVNSFKGLIIVI